MLLLTNMDKFFLFAICFKYVPAGMGWCLKSHLFSLFWFILYNPELDFHDIAFPTSVNHDSNWFNNLIQIAYYVRWHIVFLFGLCTLAAYIDGYCIDGGLQVGGWRTSPRCPALFFIRWHIRWDPQEKRVLVQVAVVVDGRNFDEDGGWSACFPNITK